MKISLCMIVRDEEDVIARCINSVKEVIDEIIIVDTGSVDNTVAIVEELGAKVYYFEWIDDFAAARNYSFSKATYDYIMWLDADDIIELVDLQKLKKIKEKLDGNIDSIGMKYVVAVDEYGETLYSIFRNRLVRRDKNFRWIGKVHEYLLVDGNIYNADINIYHRKEKEYTNRNLRIYEKILKNGEEFTVRDTLHYAEELHANGRYEEAIENYIKVINKPQEVQHLLGWALNQLINIYIYMEDVENQVKYILELKEYDIPRTNFCCIVGTNFLDKGKIDEAIMWYSLAINTFSNPLYKVQEDIDSKTYTPWIKLCECYIKKGEYELADKCNEKAGHYRPNDSIVIENRIKINDKLKKCNN